MKTHNSYKQTTHLMLALIACSLLIACGSKKSVNEPSNKEDITNEQSEVTTPRVERFNYDGSPTQTQSNKRQSKSALSMELTVGQAIHIQNSDLSIANPGMVHLVEENGNLYFATTSPNEALAAVSKVESSQDFNSLSIVDFPNDQHKDYDQKVEVLQGQNYWVSSFNQQAFVRSLLSVEKTSDRSIEVKYKSLESTLPTPMPKNSFNIEHTSDSIKSGSIQLTSQPQILARFASEVVVGSDNNSLPVYVTASGDKALLSVDQPWFQGSHGVAEIDFPEQLSSISDSEFYASEGTFTPSRELSMEKVYLIRLENLWERSFIAFRITQKVNGQINFIYKAISIQQLKENQWSSGQ